MDKTLCPLHHFQPCDKTCGWWLEEKKDEDSEEVLKGGCAIRIIAEAMRR